MESEKCAKITPPTTIITTSTMTEKSFRLQLQQMIKSVKGSTPRSNRSHCFAKIALTSVLTGIKIKHWLSV